MYLFFLSDADRMLKSGYLSLTAQVPDEVPPAEALETTEKDVTGSGTNQNIIGLLQSQDTPGVQGNIQSNFLSTTMCSQVAV